ncbi:DUF4173 domain-containing protein [Actinotalea sp. K2]|uniref:DUF4153 domain-containing protein n=1 Tax=Actinotalea sp. K2 TaxID=2939438 RepID=UPI002017508C|nr:DUF4173 domain-containing protein [Actinotalea sp. K2]MCL3861400.1 DUF4173 domain-containing protein [Actinotalea sp. K2]
MDDPGTPLPPTPPPPSAPRPPSDRAVTPTATSPGRPGPSAPSVPPGPTTTLLRAPGPTVSLPRPPGPVTTALRDFWAEDRRTVPAPVLVGITVSGLAGGILVVGHRPGLGIGLVGLVVWGAAVPALLRRRAVGDLATAALCVALVAVVAVRDAGWLVGLCVAAAAVVGATAATSARSAPAVLLGVLSWAAGGLRAVRWLSRSAGELVGPRRAQALVVLRSVAVTAVLLLVFGLLFAAADLVFASYLRVDLGLLPGRVVVGVLVAVLAATLAHLALAPPAWSTLGLPPARPVSRGEWLLPVLALDAMVLAFVTVQVVALLGGHQHVLETAGLTYAQYARQGFAQLVAATALTLVVVAVAARRAPRETARDRLVTRAALGVLCVATLGVVVSALHRMSLYVDAFGLTRLRVSAVLAEIVLGLVLVLVLVAGVRWRGGWLPRAVVHVAAAALLGLAVANPDAMIVRYNVAADPGADAGSRTAAALDVTYLQGLSADAVPTMAELDEPLRSCLLAGVEVAPASGGLAGWNLSRAQAHSTWSDGSHRSLVTGRC